MSGNSEGGCDAVGEGYEGYGLTRGREDSRVKELSHRSRIGAALCRRREPGRWRIGVSRSHLEKKNRITRHNRMFH